MASRKSNKANRSKKSSKKGPVSARIDPDKVLHKAFRLHKKGALSEAQRLYQRILSQQPGHFDALQLLGSIHIANGHHFEAVRVLEKAVTLDDRKADVHCNLGVAYKGAQRLDAARESLQAAIKLSPEFHLAHFQLGRLELDQKRMVEAQEHLNQAYRLSANHTGTVHALFELFSESGVADQAQMYIEQLRRLEPDNARWLLAQARLLQTRQQIESARSLVAQAEQMAARDAALWAEIGNQWETLNDLQAACRCAEISSKYDPGYLLAKVIQVRGARRLGRFEQALEIARASLDSEATSDTAAALYNEYGLLLDQRGDTAQAFDAFGHANALMAARSDAEQISSDIIWQLLTDLMALSPTDLPVAEPGTDDFQPVFFCGFPRSGTTLVEQVLQQSKGVTSSNEAPVLSQIAWGLPGLLGEEGDFLDLVRRLDPQQIQHLRATYREVIRYRFGEQATRGLFVDKMPLNIWFLPLVKVLFPQARILVAIRDPRDVCLSCFMQLFETNQSMAIFNDLGATAELYRKTFDLWSKYKQEFGLHYLEYRYEDLVEDFDRTSQSIFDFLGLEWSPEVGQFYTRAADRFIDTPSYDAVSKPVNARAVGRWRGYAQQIAPFRELLEPYLRAYGYPLD